MSAALKPKRVDSEEEEDDKIQYIEVKVPSEIKAILRAEKQASKKEEKPTPTTVQPKQEKNPSPPTQQKKPKDRKFIKDDRQRQYPRQKEQTKQQPHKSSSPETKVTEKQTKLKKEQPQRQEEKERIDKNQKNRKESQADKKVVYVQKSKKNESEEHSQKVKQTEKKEKFIARPRKTRIQIENRNGEEVEVELLQDQQQYENQIYIGKKKSVEDYLRLAKKLLHQYDFIILKAFGNMVSKAFLITGYLGEDTPKLKQISIPGSVKVRETVRKQEKIKTRGAISIQLSLYSLEKNHIGYQEPSGRSTIKPKQSKYVEKPDPSKKFKEKVVADDRALR